MSDNHTHEGEQMSMTSVSGGRERQRRALQEIREYVNTFPTRHEDWTAEQWFWRWRDVYDEPTTLPEALGSSWAHLFTRAEICEAHERLSAVRVYGQKVVR